MDETSLAESGRVLVVGRIAYHDVCRPIGSVVRDRQCHDVAPSDAYLGRTIQTDGDVCTEPRKTPFSVGREKGEQVPLEKRRGSHAPEVPASINWKMPP